MVPVGRTQVLGESSRNRCAGPSYADPCGTGRAVLVTNSEDPINVVRDGKLTPFVAKLFKHILTVSFFAMTDLVY